jgi:hypothetical protein
MRLREPAVEPGAQVGEHRVDLAARPVDRVRRRAGDVLDVEAAALAFDTPVDGMWLSDHFGVVVDIELTAATG